MIGQLLNQYRLEEVVGSGGMGVVYRALDMNLERTVAVKILSASFRDDPEFIERFRQEARIQAGLNHPNIATLFDFFVWNDMPVAVMEFIEGETLRSMVDRSGPIPAHIALPMFIQALRGVAAGHKRGIIHRDLKPSNIMVTHEGTVKITDFGIAKVRSNTGFTRESTRVGSAKYMAPEQILGRPVDERTDIYIMGGTLYELLTGRPPFQGVSQFEIDSAHVRDRPKPPTEFCPDIPPRAVDAIMRALAKEPSERFGSAEEFIQALPDLHGVPYIAPIDDDATRLPQSAPKAASAQLPRAQRPQPPASDETLLQEHATKARTGQLSETASAEEASSQQTQPKRGHARIAGPAIAVGALLVLSILAVAHYSARQADGDTDQGALPQSVLPEHRESTRHSQLTASPNTASTAPPNRVTTAQANAASTAPPTTTSTAPSTATSTAPLTTTSTAPPTAPSDTASTGATAAPSQTFEGNRDLTGIWTASYLDRSGRARLQLLNLQMRQVADGAITGRFAYKAGNSAGEDCTLDKSSYSSRSKRLRLITHCHNPDHPKYLNVPLEFLDVDPGAATIEGGRLAFHLADDIVVTLERTKGT